MLYIEDSFSINSFGTRIRREINIRFLLLSALQVRLPHFGYQKTEYCKQYCSECSKYISLARLVHFILCQSTHQYFKCKFPDIFSLPIKKCSCSWKFGTNSNFLFFTSWFSCIVYSNHNIICACVWHNRWDFRCLTAPKLALVWNSKSNFKSFSCNLASRFHNIFKQCENFSHSLYDIFTNFMGYNGVQLSDMWMM